MSSPHDTITAKNETIFRLKVIVAILVLLVALDFMASYQIYEDKVALQDELNYTKQQATIYKSMAIDAQSKIEDYKQANEQLIKYSTPCSVTKAAKHTPLPPLKRG